MKQWRLEIFLNEKGPATNTGRDQDDPREGSLYTQHYGGGRNFVWAQSLSHSPLVSPQSILFCRASSSLVAKPSINTVCLPAATLLSACHWARSLAADSKNVEESGDHATSLGVWFSRLEATRSSGFRCVNA